MPVTLLPIRPPAHLAALARRYPRAWRQVDELRAARGRGLPDWPAWCFLPLAGAYAIVSGGRPLPPADTHWVGVLGALAAWRVTQGVHRSDPTVLDAVWSTPVAGEIPTEVLYHLPEWCVYVLTPEKTLAGWPLHGFYAHLEADSNDGRTELRFVLDLTTPRGDDLLPVPLHLDQGGLVAALEAARREEARQAERLGHSADPRLIDAATLRQVAADLAPLVSLVLYLCSQAADLRDARGSDRQPTRPRPTRTRAGERTFPPERLTTWDVGARLGPALRRALDADRPPLEGPPGTHASPRPHLRRAHWHHFWTGPRAKPEARTAVLKWLPPIPVNVEDEGELVPTIREVTE